MFRFISLRIFADIDIIVRNREEEIELLRYKHGHEKPTASAALFIAYAIRVFMFHKDCCQLKN